jgi:hypothetical protein
MQLNLRICEIPCDQGKFPGFFYSAGINGAWGVSDKVKQYGNGVHRNGSAVFVALMYFD